ncbi:MAG: hypothetical protein ACT4QB_04015 [Gammaproteobacteria bacterium]
MDDPRPIPRLSPHGRLLLAPSDEEPELEAALAERLTDGPRSTASSVAALCFHFRSRSARAAAGTQGARSGGRCHRKSPAVLDEAIAVTGFDGRVVIGSW